MRITAVAVAVACLVVASAVAQEPVDTSNEGGSWFDQFEPRGSAWSGFRLFNGCNRIRGIVAVQADEDSGNDYGVTWPRVRNLVESRLRAARLYAELEGDSPEGALEVNVWFSGAAVAIAVEFNKLVRDPVSNRSDLAVTWSTSRLGTHGGDGDFVMQHVSELVDEFILVFLRENDEACRERDP